MCGHWTPHQVASRIQQYFKKLNHFGVNVDWTWLGVTFELNIRLNLSREAAT